MEMIPLPDKGTSVLAKEPTETNNCWVTVEKKYQFLQPKIGPVLSFQSLVFLKQKTVARIVNAFFIGHCWIVSLSCPRSISATQPATVPKNSLFPRLFDRATEIEMVSPWKHTFEWCQLTSKKKV